MTKTERHAIEARDALWTQLPRELGGGCTWVGNVTYTNVPESGSQPIADRRALLAALKVAEDALVCARDAMRAPIDGWKGEVERVALDSAAAALKAIGSERE